MDISGLHHVGLVVDDMGAALATFRRLGFALPPPSYPTMSPREGEPPRPFGAANTHADFPRTFVELATYVKPDGSGQVPPEATSVPLHVPAELLPVVLRQIESTSARLATYLDRFEGAHILIFSAPDVEVVAARLSAAGIGHSGVNTVQRPVGPRVETIHVLELDALLPGERPPALPALAAYTVAVADLGHTTDLLRGNEVPHRATTSGDLFVPASSALGAAIIFRQHGR